MMVITRHTSWRIGQQRSSSNVYIPPFSQWSPTSPFSSNLCARQTSQAFWSTNEKCLKISACNLKSVAEHSASFVAESWLCCPPVWGSPDYLSSKLISRLSCFNCLSANLGGPCLCVLIMCMYIFTCMTGVSQHIEFSFYGKICTIYKSQPLLLSLFVSGCCYLRSELSSELFSFVKFAVYIKASHYYCHY